MATYRRSAHRSRFDDGLRERLVDMAWGLAFGVPAGLVLWLATLGWWAVYG